MPQVQQPCPYDHFFVTKMLLAYSGSVWQLMRDDILLYVLAYTALAMVYMGTLAASPESRVVFESLAHWLQDVRSSVPLSFLLGFYVSAIISRWWSAIGSVPYVLSAACASLSTISPTTAEEIPLARRIRCSIIRYLNLGWVIAMCDISDAIRYRVMRRHIESHECQHLFIEDDVAWKDLVLGVNSDEVVQETFGCLVTEDDEIEAERLRQLHFSNEMPEKYKAPYWFPRVRALQLLQQATEAGYVRGERTHLKMAKAINDFFGGVGTMYLFSMYKIPLVYTQVVIIAVYTYVYIGIFAMQMLDPKVTGVGPSEYRNTTVPILEHPMLLLQFLPLGGLLEYVFYIGWFKIGMVLLEPFGREIADIPLSEVLDYNLRSGRQVAGHLTFDSADLLSGLHLLRAASPVRKVRVAEEFFRWIPDSDRRPLTPATSQTSVDPMPAAAAADGSDAAAPLLPEAPFATFDEV